MFPKMAADMLKVRFPLFCCISFNHRSAIASPFPLLHPPYFFIFVSLSLALSFSFYYTLSLSLSLPTLPLNLCMHPNLIVGVVLEEHTFGALWGGGTWEFLYSFNTCPEQIGRLEEFWGDLSPPLPPNTPTTTGFLHISLY